MAPDLAAARELVALAPVEEELLGSSARPIVLARPRPDARVAAAVAPRSDELGVMLPYSPLHHLLLADTGRTLVMTSGNVSDEPIAFDDEEACRAARRHRGPVPGPRPADRDPHGRQRRARGGRPPAGAAALARLRARFAAAAGGLRPPPARDRSRAEEHVRGGQGHARLGGASRRRPQELRDAAFVRGGDRALPAALRGRAGSGRARPAPRLPVHQARARARRCGARRRAAPPRPPRGLPRGARRDRPRRSGRSSTAPATARTARCGAGSCCSATCAASSEPGSCSRCGCRAARPLSASRGGWPARGSRPPRWSSTRCPWTRPPGSRCPRWCAAGWRPRSRPAWAGCSTRSRRSAACARRSTTRGRRPPSSRRLLDPAEEGAYPLPLRDDGGAPLVIDARPTVSAVVEDLRRGAEVATVAARFHNARRQRHRRRLRAGGRALRHRDRRAVRRGLPEQAADGAHAGAARSRRAAGAHTRGASPQRRRASPTGNWPWRPRDWQEDDVRA